MKNKKSTQMAHTFSPSRWRKKAVLCLAFLAFLLPIIVQNQLSGQCQQVGWVASDDPNCGIKIIDLENGKVLRAVSGTGSVSVGTTISFSKQIADPLASCVNDTLETISLTCVSDILPCKADFVPYPDENDPLTIHFLAQIFDPITQNCTWNFGDGNTGNGTHAVHTFSKEGTFQVTLEVKGNGCSAIHTHEIKVSKANAGNCYYDLRLTAVGQNLLGSVVPNSSLAGTLKNVVWYFSKTNQIIAQTAEFEYPLHNFGIYNVCAEIVTELPDGSTCISTRCETIELHPPGCHNPVLNLTEGLCPTFFAPVCGCDGVTYANECEAFSSGVSAWWPGKCGAVGSCMADLDVEVVTGNHHDGFLAKFYNLVSGDFAYLQLDFGDGSLMLQTSNWTSFEHRYTEAGIYLATLTIWKTGGCVSSITKVVNTDLASATNTSTAHTSEHVFPGDANGDRQANAYDLLNVGVGYFSDGAPRPQVSTEWSPQIAPNWSKKTGTGVNFKHLDCDGNGSINELELGVINKHYQHIQPTFVPHVPDLPKVWLDFSINPDTIFIDPQQPKPLEIYADVMVASVQQPIFDLYGLAFAVRYPQFVNNDPIVDYFDFSTFGFTNDILWLPKNDLFKKQLDLSFVRKNGVGRNGYFKMARIQFKTDFIIIVDVVAREEASPKPFVADVRGLLAIDAKGLPKGISVPDKLDTIWVKLKPGSVATNPLDFQKSIEVAPNPTSDFTKISAPQHLKIEKVQVCNVLGHVLFECKGSTSSNLDIPTRQFNNGLYILKIQTNQGWAEKRLIVTR